MKKQLIFSTLALTVIAGGVVGITHAASDATKTQSGQAITITKNADDGQKNNKDDGQEGNKDDGKKGNKDDGQKNNKDDLNETVSSNTYENKYGGLIDAIGDDKNKPVGAIIANLLLTRYGSHLTDDMKIELESMKDKDEALSKFADILVKSGSVTDAVYVEKSAIKANIENLDSYKKLGILYEKLGKVGVKLYVNGDEASADIAPFISNGSTLVPFRAISEALKATVGWNGEERSVTVTRGNTMVKLFIDSKTAFVNDNPVTLEVPATIESGSTVVPVRFVSEALKATIKWEPDSKSVIIYEK